MNNFPKPLISPTELLQNLNNPNLIILDASMKPVGQSQADSAQEFPQILGARRFDFDEKICDKSTGLPHMMPTPEVFEREVRALGVNQESHIVVYDRIGLFSSPRAWWMFRAMGFDNVAVLDGGLPAWIKMGGPTQNEIPQITPGNFTAHPRTEFFCDADFVAKALQDSSYLVLDARSEKRFYAQEPEPRAGLKGGHMPNAQNIPFMAIQNQGVMKPVNELQKIFAEKITTQKHLIFTCGSAVTACVLALAAEIAGYKDLCVYDGSWAEWGASGRAIGLS